MLNDLKARNFFLHFNGDNLYEFMVCVYAFAKKHETKFIDFLNLECQKDESNALFRSLDILTGRVEPDDIEVVLDELRKCDPETNIHDNKTALLFVVVLLSNLDEMLRQENPFLQKKRLLKSPYLYETYIAEEKTFLLLPRFSPVFEEWLPDNANKYEKRTEAHTVFGLNEQLLNRHVIVEAREDVRFAGRETEENPGTMETGAVRDLENSLKEASNDGLRIALAAIDEGFAFSMKTFGENKNGKTLFVVTGVKAGKKEDCIVPLLETALQNAWEEHVDILIFPELSVDEKGFQAIAQWLSSKNTGRRLKLIIPGSAHVYDAKEKKYFNICRALNGNGEKVFAQSKRKAFEILKHETMPNSIENISSVGPIAFLDTPLGRINIAICLDYLEEKRETLVKEYGTKILLVPAMTSKDEDFRNCAFSRYGLGRNILSAVCASKSGFGSQGEEFSFLYPPCKTGRKNFENRKIPVTSSKGLLIYDIRDIMQNDGKVRSFPQKGK